ncbi:Variant surface glycoprotein [Trypanosoma congolense IL3000]|uniref:Variant surface glycoprotein n=1 Tax=Trypanosoma congolense (strain IL3000) TaxID=1068625 RepID=F9WAI1_TRYCI|nr:Variant surface glycoprotein [Trypanosoma congolense IL3000]
MFLVFIWMMMLGLSGSSLGTGISEHHNHNRDNHDVLCSVLKATVTLYKRHRSGERLKKALKRAIFGNESGEGNIETLMETLPEEYNHPGNRQHSCGSCTYGDSSDYPGWSIPHDILCMCTVGSGGFPFLDRYDGTATLCGRSSKELGCDKHQQSGGGCHNGNTHWWNDFTESYNGNGKVKEHLEATWKKVVKTCLETLSNITPGQARETLLKQLKVDEGRSSPSWARGHGPCGGGSADVCVSYGYQCHDNPKSPQWWQELYETLTASEDTHSKEKSTRTPRKRTRRKTEDAPTTAEPEDDSEEDVPQDRGSESAKNRPLPLLSHQQSGAPLPPPHSCLLSAVFFF